MKPKAKFPIVDLTDYDIAEKTIHYNKVNYVIGKPKLRIAEGKENLEKVEFIFTVDSKTLVQKHSVDPKLM